MMTIIHRISYLLALVVFAPSLMADDFTDGEMVGKVFWVKPAKEVYRRLEFYRQPKLDGVTFFPHSKQRVKISAVNRGWIKLNFIGAYNGFEDAYVPLGYFRKNYYNAAAFNGYAFDRATFFLDDPDEIKARAAAASLPPAVKKGESKSIASKFFRHKNKCCGIGGMEKPNFNSRTRPSQ